MLDLFVSSCGISFEELYEHADQPEAWAAILDFILSADEIIMDFCDTVGCDAQDIWRARSNLPGAPQAEAY